MDSVRQFGTDDFEPLFDCFCHLLRGLFAHAGNVQQDGRHTVVGGIALGILKPIPDDGDVFQADQSTVGSGHDRKTGKLMPAVAPFGHAEQDFAGVGVDAAPR